MTKEQIKKYIPPGLDEETAGRLQWHIEHCNACQSVLDKKESVARK